MRLKEDPIKAAATSSAVRRSFLPATIPMVISPDDFFVDWC